MAYPYGAQGAPAVGNGLGGLPRRAVPAAAAAVASGPKLYQADLSTKVQVTSFYASSVNFGNDSYAKITHVGGGKFVIPYQYYNGSYETYRFALASITEAGITLLTDSSNGDGVSGPTMRMRSGISFVSGNYLVTPQNWDGNWKRLDLTTGSITSHGAFNQPSSLTIASGTYAGVSVTNIQGAYYGDTGLTPSYQDSAGFGWFICHATVSGSIRLLALKYNSTGTLQDSFVIGDTGGNNSTRYVWVVWWETVNGKLVTYTISQDASGIGRIAASTFDIAAKTYTTIVGQQYGGFSSYSYASGPFAIVSKDLVAVGFSQSSYDTTVVNGMRTTFYLDNGLPTVSGTGESQPYNESASSGNMHDPAYIGVPETKYGLRRMVVPIKPRFSQTANSVDPIYKDASISPKYTTLLPLTYEYESVRVVDADGIVRVHSHPRMTSAVLTYTDNASDNTDFSVSVVTDCSISPTVFLGTSKAEYNATNYKALSLVLFKAS